MRRKEKEISDKKEMEAILKQSKVGRIALVDGDRPYIIPVNFGYRAGTLFFHSAPEGRKIELIQKNPNICFEVDQVIKFKKSKIACEWSVEYKSVIAFGKAALVNGREEKEDALKTIMAQYSGKNFEFPAENLDRTVVIKMTVEQMTGKQSV